MPKSKLTSELFISRSKEIHGNKYDYSLTEYKNATTKVKIICPVHGEFEQIPHNHLKGAGCKKCASESRGMNNRFSTEQFISWSRKIHENKYDYSLTEYKDCKTKVTIICPEHGEFYQNPDSHWRGFGCKKCATGSLAKKLSMSKEEFIKRSNEKHNHFYDYSLVNYQNTLTEVAIICPDHGVFYQLPKTHMKGNACKKCAINSSNKKRSIPKEEFISRANEIHNYFYDYSQVDYQSRLINVAIVCPEHGVFYQTPKSHLRGGGCKDCANDNMRSQRQMTKSDFIKRAKEVHGDRYDYSNVIMRNSHTPVEIICEEHGIFYQNPNSHLIGNTGCKECSSIQRGDIFRKSTDQFIEDAKAVHGDKYNYDYVDYVNSGTHVNVECPDHGIFKTYPSNHLKGFGCAKCGIRSGTSKAEEDIVTFLTQIYQNEIIINNRHIIAPYELDIYLPDINLAIEFNGCYYHSIKFKEDAYYHRRKTRLCNEKDITLHHIFEDDWLLDSDRVKYELKLIIEAYTSGQFYEPKQTEDSVVVQDLSKAPIMNYSLNGYTHLYDTPPVLVTSTQNNNLKYYNCGYRIYSK